MHEALPLSMATTLQIRSIDESLAAAAKAEAARRRMSVSDYLKDLITRDLDARSSAERRRAVYDALRAHPDRPRIDRETLLAARDAARDDMVHP